MATAEQVKALLKSHFEGDEDRFYAVAIQVAAHAARQGKSRVANDIRALIDQAKAKAPRAERPIPITTPKGGLAALLSASYPNVRLGDMVLSGRVEGRLRRILREQRGRDKLLAHGLPPRRKLLLVGPPGSGKTMTASALAGELRLPLYSILLHSLITKFMGETAAKLKLVFDGLADQRGVYLFDEFDAIGGERSAANDVGEIRRVLNSFLQFLEQDQSSSVLVAATNHPEALDRALFRRFDDVIEYSHPSEELIEESMKNSLAAFDTRRVAWSKLRQAARGLSHAEITAACHNAAKDSILSDSPEITTEAIMDALAERKQEHSG